MLENIEPISGKLIIFMHVCVPDIKTIIDESPAVFLEKMKSSLSI